MTQKAYILNDDLFYNIVAGTVRLAQDNFPNLSEIEVAQKVLDDKQFIAWKSNYDEVQRLNEPL